MNLDPSAFVADPSLIETLETGSAEVVCSEETVLFRQGDQTIGLFILKSGDVTLKMTSPVTSEVVTMEARLGSLLGLPAIVGDVPYTLTAIARPGAVLACVTRDAFSDIMRNDPSLALKVLKILAAEVRSARTAILQRSPSARNQWSN